MAVRAAQKADIPVSVCGEMAGDPFLCHVLAGMGITELSMNPGAIGGVKQAVTGISKKRRKRKPCGACPAPPLARRRIFWSVKRRKIELTGVWFV
jgi:phosphoenolpyruvate-protein kinase (PTS system EI component)